MAARTILNVRVTRISTVDIYRKLVLAFKGLKNMTPEYLNVFSFVSQISSRRTRNGDNGILYSTKISI